MKNCDKFPHGGPGIQRIAGDRIQKFPVPVVPAESHDGTKSMFHTGAAFFKMFRNIRVKIFPYIKDIVFVFTSHFQRVAQVMVSAIGGADPQGIDEIINLFHSIPPSFSLFYSMKENCG